MTLQEVVNKVPHINPNVSYLNLPNNLILAINYDNLYPNIQVSNELILSNFVKGKNLTYELYSFIVDDGGHYIAFVNHQGEWHKLDDNLPVKKEEPTPYKQSKERKITTLFFKTK
eukprot:TRINITY_DN17783_c0_g2_i1.p1 TRINITY_DN17783_c0_g2~~TRINITY_DN17783_c0_g2_i1.p1  ORF type:complete len:115 (+),score=21.46 TRINITY_DN17783_c0_g2_i1:113-457(+)